jgi:hypothetical protein
MAPVWPYGDKQVTMLGTLISLGARPDRALRLAFVAGWPAQAAFARVNSLLRL